MTELQPRPHNTNLVAVRDAKERAVELISQRFSEDLIGADELERRLERVEQARSLDEIDVVVDDLLDPGTSLMPSDPASGALVPASAGAPGVLVATNNGDVPEDRQLVAIFGEQRQGGAWLVPRQIDSFTMFAGTELDFREAQLAPGVTVIDLKVMFGGVKIIVPPGLAVECGVMAIFGGVDRDPTIPESAAGEHTPRLSVTGFVMFGGVEIRERLPGESGRQARKRRRKEQRHKLAEAREARQRMLGPG